jgi:hypothetical protein
MDAFFETGTDRVPEKHRERPEQSHQHFFKLGGEKERTQR